MQFMGNFELNGGISKAFANSLCPLFPQQIVQQVFAISIFDSL